MTTSAEFQTALTRVLPDGHVLADRDMVRSYLHDEAEWAPYGQAVAVVRPHSTDEVRVVVSTEAMKRILEIDEAERLAVVQPGVVNDDLRAACAERGLWYPPDPASAPWSTIGGNVATNAGGVCCVKYGVTRDYVLAVQAVVGRGEVVRLGRRTAKGVAGYDLCGLMVGSEGTLGVITEITVRLRGARAPEHTVVGYFDTLRDAGEAVSRVTAAGIVPSALELVDRRCLEAVDAWRNMGLSADANVLLLGRTDLPGEAGEAEADAMVALFKEAGAT